MRPILTGPARGGSVQSCPHPLQCSRSGLALYDSGSPLNINEKRSAEMPNGASLPQKGQVIS